MSDSNFVFNVIFWIRVAFGVISGFSAGLLGFTSDNPDANMGIFFGISMYLLSTAIVRQIFLSKIKEGERLKLFTTDSAASSACSSSDGLSIILSFSNLSTAFFVNTFHTEK